MSENSDTYVGTLNKCMCLSLDNSLFEKLYMREMIIKVSDFHNVGEKLIIKAMDVKNDNLDRGSAQPCREVVCVYYKSQCYVFPGNNEMEACDVVIIGTILVCDRMDNVLFDPGYTYCYVSMRFASEF